MAEFRLTKRAKLDSEPQPEVATVDENGTPTLLGHVGSAVHTLGSILSTPSRWLHGTLNAATGGEGGFGNLNPLDATGGIEASHNLIRLGVLPENDPTAWEGADFAGGAADFLGDPTTWLGVGGLTKAGAGAAKVGGLAKGFIPQVAAGQRAIANVRVPFAGIIGEIGTGAKVADALKETGRITRLTPAAKAIAGSKPVRVAKGLFNAKYEGTTHPAVQKHMPARFEELQKARRGNQELLIRLGREIQGADDEAIRAGAGMTPSQQVHSALEGISQAPPEFGHHVDELQQRFGQSLGREQSYGTGYRSALDDPLEFDDLGNPTKYLGYGPRYTNPVHGGSILGGAGKAAKRRENMLKGFKQGTYAPGGVNDVLHQIGQLAKSDTIQLLPDKQSKIAAISDWIAQNHGPNILPNYVTKGGREVNRYQELARYALAKPKLGETKLFTNAPLADVGRSLDASVTRSINGKTVANVLADHLGNAASDDQMSLGKALKQLGYRHQEMAEQIALRRGMDPAKIADPKDWQRAIRSMLNEPVDADVVKQITFMNPRNVGTAAAEQAGNWWQMGLNLFKSGILAFPSSRVRDLVSGGVQNMLHNWASPHAYAESKRLMAGEVLKGDYSKVPEVVEWFSKKAAGGKPIPMTPENQTEAVRQIAAVMMPREHGFLGDLPSGQAGFELKDVLRNVPGQRPSSLKEQFVTGPAAAFTEPTPGKWNPLSVRGVGGRTETTFAPIKASERFADASDRLNRGAGFFRQLHQGANADVAAKNVNRAQVDYSPDTFSGTEKWLKRNFFPFEAFTSRMLLNTGRELADFGSPTAQLIKAQDRAYGGDPAVPDYVLDQSGVPLATLPDGTKRMLGGLGLQHESAAKMLGQAAQGDVRGLALNTLAQLNPFAASPIEQATGVSFSRDGEPITNLESNTGRLLSNLGVLARLRDRESGPIRYPGQPAVDFLAGLTPIGRVIQQARLATDLRRGPAKLLTQEEPIEPLQAAQDLAAGIAPLATGVRISDISPAKQVATLKQRAEKLAASSGGKSRTEVYFPKAAMEQLKKDDPQLAAKQLALTRYINSLRTRQQKSKKKESNSKEFRLTKRSES